MQWNFTFFWQTLCLKRKAALLITKINFVNKIEFTHLQFKTHIQTLPELTNLCAHSRKGH